jgi:hypothetical protein
MALHDRAFYGQWILANGLAEAIGLGTTLVIGNAAAPLLDSISGSTAAVLVAALTAVVLGMVLEGVVVGLAQERVLQTRTSLPPWAWTIATAIGAAAAWLLGMVPSTAMAFIGDGVPGDPASEPAQPVQLALAVLMGLVTGPVLGFAQWLVLRGAVRHAGRWLWANAVAWGAGMPLIFGGMDRVPWTGAPQARIAAIYAVCAVTGLVVGAVHGAVLVRLLRSESIGVGR